MILLLALIAALLWGLIRGGKVEKLGSLPLRQGGWALGALVLQSVLIYSHWLDNITTRSMALALMLISYALLLFFITLNYRLSGIVIIGLGLALNATVILANGGYMPTSPEALQRGGYTTSASQAVLGKRLGNSKDIVLIRDTTPLWFLSDIFVIPPPFPWPTVFSIGDILIAAGAVVLVSNAMLSPVLSNQLGSSDSAS